MQGAPPAVATGADLLPWVLWAGVAAVIALAGAIVALWRRGEARAEADRVAHAAQYESLAAAVRGVSAQLGARAGTQTDGAGDGGKPDSGRTKTIAEQTAERVVEKLGDRKTVNDAVTEVRTAREAVEALAAGIAQQDGYALDQAVTAAKLMAEETAALREENRELRNLVKFLRGERRAPQ